jgi:hypothetical protein
MCQIKYLHIVFAVDTSSERGSTNNEMTKRKRIREVREIGRNRRSEHN